MWKNPRGRRVPCLYPGNALFTLTSPRFLPPGPAQCQESIRRGKVVPGGEDVKFLNAFGGVGEISQ